MRTCVSVKVVAQGAPWELTSGKFICTFAMIGRRGESELAEFNPHLSFKVSIPLLSEFSGDLSDVQGDVQPVCFRPELLLGSYLRQM